MRIVDATHDRTRWILRDPEPGGVVERDGGTDATAGGERGVEREPGGEHTGQWSDTDSIRISIRSHAHADHDSAGIRREHADGAGHQLLVNT